MGAAHAGGAAGHSLFADPMWEALPISSRALKARGFLSIVYSGMKPVTAVRSI